MKKFYLQIILYLSITLIPITFIVTRYILLDPFCDFSIDQEYSLKFWFNSLGDFSTKKLIKNNDKRSNTFIFGSSRSTHLYCCYIKKHIFENNPSIYPYYFGNYGETIGGIYQKIFYLDKHGYNLKNVFVLIDPDMAFEKFGAPQKYDHRTFTNRSLTNDYIYHFNSFFSNKHNDLNFKIKLLFGIDILDSLVYSHKSDPFTNDQGHICNSFLPYNDSNQIQKKMSSKAHLKFIESSDDFLFKKLKEKNRISNKELLYLKKIKQLFTHQNTRYVFIVSPLLSHEQLSKKDLGYLNQLFNSKNIINFAGTNAITKNIQNFKDPKHFNTLISKYILDSIKLTNTFLSH